MNTKKKGNTYSQGGKLYYFDGGMVPPSGGALPLNMTESEMKYLKYGDALPSMPQSGLTLKPYIPVEVPEKKKPEGLDMSQILGDRKLMEHGGKVPKEGKYMFFGSYPEESYGESTIDMNRMVDRQMGVESSYLPNRTSGAGAVGLAQFRPIAQKEVVRLGIMPEGWDPNDPQQARDAMYGYMENLYDREWVHAEKSDPMVAYAKAAFAYNAGEGNAKSKLTELKEKGYDIYNSLDWVSEINKESREYIEKLASMDTEKGRQFEKDWPTLDARRQKIFEVES